MSASRMIRKGILFIVLVVSQSVSFAQSPDPTPLPAPQSENELCQYYSDWEAFQRMSFSRENYLAIRNYGGLFGRGICWWHSRLFRLATYLNIYQPDLPKPTRAEAKKIIRNIVAGNRINVIPGYPNLRSFSKDWWPLIQSRLSSWQITDVFVNQIWLRGIGGVTRTSAGKLRRKMDLLFNKVSQDKDLTFIKAQVEGIEVHSFILIGMERFDGGYHLSAVDSNDVEVPYRWTYRDGDRRLKYGRRNFVPYVLFEPELRRAKTVLKEFCLDRSIEAEEVSPSFPTPLPEVELEVGGF